MFGIKRKGRAIAKKAYGILIDLINPRVGSLTVKMRLPGRIRLLERWGRNNPKKMTAYYLSFAVIILSVNIFGSLIFTTQSSNTDDPLGLTALSRTNPINGIQNINIRREIIQETLSDYNDVRIRIAIRLDSLCMLPVKTGSDSVEISKLWNLLNKPTDKTHESKTN